MSWLLQGPFPLDSNNVTGSARTALGSTERVLGPGGAEYLREVAAPGHEPGIYLLWKGGDKPALVGFWVVHGNDYLLTGPVGPPDREPPLAREVLSALVEAVWWQQLTVWPRKGGTWRPLLVQEWVPEVANRSMLPPPGQPPSDDEVGEEEEDELNEERGGGWLEPLDADTREERRADPTVVSVEVRPPEMQLRGTYEEQQLWMRLPGRRTLVSIVQGQMTASGTAHKATFRLLPPAWFSEHIGEDATPIDDWIETATRKGKVVNEDESHSLGHPMEMLGGRVGFPLAGWLTRSLGPWPNQPFEVRAGELAERDTAHPWVTQARQSIVVTISVLLAVLSLSWGVYEATRPHPKEAPEIPIPAPQPALSVCSADHYQFVEEFRCQINHFAEGGSIDEPVCGDPQADPGMTAGTRDLQASYCGLRDRSRDGWLAGGEEDGFNYSDLAASKACFNVLGHPYSYAMARDYSSQAARKVNPDLFLRDMNLSIRALVDLVGDLDDSCNQYGDRLAHQLAGGVVATHIGSPRQEGIAETEQKDSYKLRGHVVTRVSSGMSDTNRTCFSVGTRDGINTSQTYRDLCGGPDVQDAELDKRKSWAVLAGDIPMGQDQLVKRYAVSRFGYVGQMERAKAAPAWACHLNLTGGESEPGSVGVRWDLQVPVPSIYDVEGAGVMSQLGLDAALRSFADGTDGGVCWSVVAKQLERYTPVHPLLAELDPAGFPSEEQQLCGQVCAVGYRVRASELGHEWVTRTNDLTTCVSTTPIKGDNPSGIGSLDTLRLPWNGEARMGWAAPDEEAVCAFNLVAQQYMPATVLVENMAPPIWSGQVQGDAGILGTSDGAAARAAGNLSSYGRARSVSTCGHVAAQCFMTGMLKITGTYSEPYMWIDKWNEWLIDVGEGFSGLPGEETSAWCELVQPYVTMDGSLPEGQLDYPCAKGVDDTLRAVEDTLRNLASGAYAESMR